MTHEPDSDSFKADASVADCLEDLHRRRALGETISPEDYRESLGDNWSMFEEVLDAEALLETPSVTSRALPRPLGPYTLLRKIGWGAMGVVYDAVHRELGRRVALKLLTSAHEPSFEERFRREARAAAQVRNDHIVEIYEAGEADGQLYYAMSYVEGDTLQKVIKNGDVPGDNELCEQAAHVADALQELHDVGILHRDIKPSNLIYDRKDRLVLADFGLARTEDTQSLTRSGDGLGTPRYMSPEQFLGRRKDIAATSDIYGLGATMYEALLGVPPFQRDDVGALMKAVLHERPSKPSKIRPNFPPKLEYILLRCLAREPEDRYSSAAALARDLRAFAAGEAIVEEGTPWWRRAWRKIRRHPKSAAALALLTTLPFILWFALRPTTASLTVKGPEQATVSVNHASHAVVPHQTTVAPGKVHLLLRLRGHQDRVIDDLTVEAGEEATVVATHFVIQDTSNPEVLASAAARNAWPHAAPVDPNEPLNAPRSKGNFDALLLYPQGNVRVEDLRNLRAEVGVNFEGYGRFEFRRGDDVLWSSGEIEMLRTHEAIPDAVRAGLKPGDVLTWGIYDEQGTPRSTTTCNVVEGPPGEQIAKLDASLNDPRAPQSKDVKAYFRAQQLVNAKLFTGAALALEDLRNQGHVSALLIRLEGLVLQAMHADDAMKLATSHHWNQLLHAQQTLLKRRESK